MARAKRTERSEARRRYRAATAGVTAEDDDLTTPAVPAAALPRGYRDRRPASAGEPAAAAAGRSGFLGTLRAAGGPRRHPRRPPGAPVDHPATRARAGSRAS